MGGKWIYFLMTRAVISSNPLFREVKLQVSVCSNLPERSIAAVFYPVSTSAPVRHTRILTHRSESSLSSLSLSLLLILAAPGY